ncbi:MAG: hypothetical protein V4616_07415 [Bacteroidota bacterium]
MKKIVSAMVVMVALSLGATAQHKHERKTPEVRAKEQAEKLKDELNLSADQQRQIEQLKLNTANAAKPYRQEQKELKKRLKEIHKAKDEQIRALLSAEQQLKMAEISKNAKEQAKEAKKQGLESHRQLKDLHHNEQAQLKSILSKKQYEKYLENKQGKKLRTKS